MCSACEGVCIEKECVQRCSVFTSGVRTRGV